MLPRSSGRPSVALLAAVCAALTLAPSAPPAAQLPRGSLRVLVPAYFYPLASSPWSRLNAAAAAHPQRVAAIGNPGSGPGSAFDSSYSAAFAGFRASGGLLLGYVHSSYGARPAAAVKADMTQWRAWYPLDGFFIDEMDNLAGAHEAYYRDLFLHARSLVPRGIVVGNPGVSTPQSYLFWNNQRVVSALCIQESSSSFLAWQSDSWVKALPRRNFYALPYAVGASTWPSVVDHAYAENCGWIYTTDDVLPNPWDTLPSYFEALVSYVDASY